MNTKAIVQDIEVQINRLQIAKSAMLAVEEEPITSAPKTSTPTLVHSGRPAGKTHKKRVLTPEGRARISAAQKKRHAERKAA